MKVLMLSDFPVDAAKISGGVQSAAFNLVTALERYTDADVTVVSFSREVPARVSSLVGDGIRVIRAPKQARFNTATRYFRERRIFAEILREQRPDVVHGQGEGFHATLAVDSGLPNVYTVHGVQVKEIGLHRATAGRLRSEVALRSVRAHHRKARNIIVINDYTRTEIAPLHDARVWQIPNAVDETYFALSENVETGRLLVVGGVSRRKDTETALKAVRRIAGATPVRLDVVGQISTDYAAGLTPLLEAEELAGRVTLHGLVERDRLLELYAAADVFLLTSVEESSPISIVEAMAAGKPIVATDVGGVREIVSHGVNGYVCPPGRDDEIARAISGLVLDRQERNRFGEASRAAAAERWSARAVALATYDAYGEIVNGA